MSGEQTHAHLADALRRRVHDSGVIDPRLRTGLVDAAASESSELPEPYRDLAHAIAHASHRVTDEQVAAVRQAAGSDRAAFEVVIAASVGAGLRRWDAASRAIREADDASS